MRHPTLCFAVAAFVLVGVAGAALAESPTLEEVKRHGALRCGVSIGLAGFSAPDDKGKWIGLDVDFCRAVASTSTPCRTVARERSRRRSRS